MRAEGARGYERVLLHDELTLLFLLLGSISGIISFFYGVLQLSYGHRAQALNSATLSTV